MADEEPKQEFIPAETYDQELAAIGRDTRLPREINRRSVVRNFLDAFELIGGVPALAEWGNQEENKGDFYKLYARMAPSASTDPVENKGMVIKHVIPPSALDGVEDADTT